MKGLFINNSEARDSIHISGKMVYECLVKSKVVELDYIEINENNKTLPGGYYYYFFNYHPYTMAWLETKSLRKLLGRVGTVVLEVLPNDPFVLCPKYDFDFYCVLDPTIKIKNKKVHAFPRPLSKDPLPVENRKDQIPVIGSFGFATKGKGFQHVIEAVNKEFDKAMVRINIPYGDFVPNSKEYAAFLKDICEQRAKPGIEVRVTNDFMSEEQLINWCAENTLNCFLYDRNMPGLSATTDQCIISGRPLAVSDNQTFRHITRYIEPYPKSSLKDAISNSQQAVKRMQEDWSPNAFASIFNKMIVDIIGVNGPSSPIETFELSLKKYSFAAVVSEKIRKYRRKLTFQQIKKLFYDRRHNKKII